MDAFVISMREFRKRVSQENRCAFCRSLLAEVVAETSARLGASAESSEASGVSSLPSEEGDCARDKSASVHLVIRDVGVRMNAALASWSNDAYAASDVLGASVQVSGTVSGVLVACPVSALTGGQSAIVPRVSVRVSARSVVSPEASSVVCQSADKSTVA